jgi:thiamine kinase-like enzyme|tara:strand:+ start:1340 stop:2221 length:882 start_codon:yes stop_codon:yes gene_type:complete
MDLKNTLLKKLNLSEKGNFKLEKLSDNSLNDNYFLLQDNLPKFFIKTSSLDFNKEKSVSEFFHKNNLVNVILPIYSEDNLIISEYKELKEVSLEEIIESLTDFHKNSLICKEKFPYSQSIEFNNDYKSRGIARLKKHKELIKNLWDDGGWFEDVFRDLSPSFYDQFPQILTHGDLHVENIKKDEFGKIYFLDFERSLYDSPTWDLGRLILDISPDYLIEVVDKYSSEMIETTSLKKIAKKNLKKAIFGDFLYRTLTDSISMQQQESFKERVPYYFDKYRKIIEKLSTENIFEK